MFSFNLFYRVTNHLWGFFFLLEIFSFVKKKDARLYGIKGSGMILLFPATKPI